LLAEAANTYHVPYISTLLDLIKAFDSVPFDWLAGQAAKAGYNLTVLRLSIAAYLLARVIDIEGCCSKAVWASRGLTAGSVLATIELRVLLLEAADTMVSASLYCRLTLYVDDATIETVCTVARVVDTHVDSVRRFVEALHRMRMKFSDTKNVVCASANALAREVVAALDIITVCSASRARCRTWCRDQEKYGSCQEAFKCVQHAQA